MTPDPEMHSTALRRRGILDEEDLQKLQNEARMSIDIDRLSEAELIDLNHRIVARLRLLHQMRAHADMLEFRIGDRVTFQ